MAKPLPFGAALSKAGEPAPAQAIAMTYDWLNRQTRWSDGTRTESTVFAGADWKRASTTVSGADPALNRTVKYLYDDDDVLADFGADNSLVAFYVSPGLDQNLSIADASGATSYYTQDGLGSVRLLTSANGTILNRYDYTAFGEPFAPNTSTTVSNRYTYTAREQSPLATHGAPMYYRWRNYAPEVGRFMWRDPIGDEGGVNVYGYVDDFPILYSDSYGLKTVCCKKWKARYEDYPDTPPIRGIGKGGERFTRCLFDQIAKIDPILYELMKQQASRELGGINLLGIGTVVAHGFVAIGNIQAKKDVLKKRDIAIGESLKNRGINFPSSKSVSPNLMQRIGSNIGKGIAISGCSYNVYTRIKYMYEVIRAKNLCNQEKCVDEIPVIITTEIFAWYFSYDCESCPKGYSKAKVNDDGWRDK